MYNILVVDDSALMRKFMRGIINSLQDFHVADVCADGKSAYQRIKSSKYDAVTLNMSLPIMDGAEVMRKLKSDRIRVPIIALSPTEKEDRDLMRKAMEGGAVDFIPRPANINAPNLTFIRRLQEALTIAVTGKKGTAAMMSQIPKNILSQTASLAPSPILAVKARYDLIALASSTGGPQALQTMLPMLPAHIGVPMVIVQHMPKGFTASLASRINVRSALTVKEAEQDELLQPDHVYIAAGGRQMQIVEKGRGVLACRVYDSPPVNNLRPCADVMYESLKRCSVRRILCVVLTGMGADGSQGILSLKRLKTLHTITQSERSCVVYGMPKAAVEAGVSDETADIREMANAITKELGV